MPSVSPEAVESIAAASARLRAEIAATTDKPRIARLYGELGELSERIGDEPTAARDYLAAFNADPTFREPLEGLVRLLERRRSLKNLGRLLDALVRAAETPEERARALTMRAAFVEDVTGEPGAAKDLLHDATTSADAPDHDIAGAWLALELLAGKTSDPDMRLRALAERTKRAGEPTWQALLLVDLARMTASSDVPRALELLEQARRLGGGATFLAALAQERLARPSAASATGSMNPESKLRTDAYATALEAQAELILAAIEDGSVGDERGVPRAVRSAAFMADAWLRAADVRRLSGELHAAARTLDRALEVVGATPEAAGSVEHRSLLVARMRVAELTGDTALAAKLAEQRLASEKDGGVAASLAMRVAEQAASTGDANASLAALSRAVAHDPVCLPARALQLDLLADGAFVSPSPASAEAFASQLEAFAEHLPTDGARARAFLLAAYVWGVHGATSSDEPGGGEGAKAALAQARTLGVPGATVWRAARLIAAVRRDAVWFEEATRRLVATHDQGGEAGTEKDGAPSDDELPYLWFDVVRARAASAEGDPAALAAALRGLDGAPGGAWLASAITVFLPGTAAAALDQARAVDRLGDLETLPDRVRALVFLGARRAQDVGDVDGARERLRALAVKDPADVLVATWLAELERAAGAHASAASALTTCAMALKDDTGAPTDLVAALFLEAGFERWRANERAAALDAFEHAASLAPEAANAARAWAARALQSGDDAGSALDARRRALDLTEAAGEDPAWVALERFAVEAAAPAGAANDDAAEAALEFLANDAQGDLGTAGALARLVAKGADDPSAEAREQQTAAAFRLATLGDASNELAAAEQFRVARAADPEAALEAAQRWHEAGGGAVAGLEWLAAAMAIGSVAVEAEARRGLAGELGGDAEDALAASAALLEAKKSRAPERTPLVGGEGDAVHLANLVLAPPGSDPRRRARALEELEGALGDEATLDATAQRGWVLFTSGELAAALVAFEAVLLKRPNDLASWEGRRAAAAAAGDKARQARAAAELGSRCASAQRAAAFAEEAGLIYLELGHGELAERALELSFAKDPQRGVAFDRLFRRVRERKDGDKLLALIARRQEVSEDPEELAKLFWEQARVLREKGDVDGALRALESVTMFEPEHVGALALTGEIFIRRGMYEEAATNLAKLATIPEAPPKNRVTAGIAAVDLYENKLDRYDLALDVLLHLHKAKLSTLPVRERLARAAARVGAWKEATSILEELMHERPEPAGRVEAARLALAIYRDRIGEVGRAANAVVKILDESPGDGEAVDTLFDVDVDAATRRRLLARSRESLLAAVRGSPLDATLARRIGRVAHSLGDTELEHVALSTHALLVGTDSMVETALANFVSRKPRVPQAPMTDAAYRLLFAPGDDGPIAAAFQALAPVIGEALAPKLATLGVGKRDKVDPKSGLALRGEVAIWAGAFGIRELDVYVGGNLPDLVQGVPGEVPALVLGANVRSPLPTAARALVARELFALARGTTLLRLRDAGAVEAIVTALFHLGGVPVDARPHPQLVEIERAIDKAISRKVKKTLPETCRAIAAGGQEPRVWSRRALVSMARAALVASGDVPFVVSDVMGDAVERVRPGLKNDERAVEIVRFAFSAEYLEIRRVLGLEALS